MLPTSISAQDANWAYLQDEFRLLKRRLLREVVSGRGTPQAQIDQLQGLVISSRDVLDILTGEDMAGQEASACDELAALNETIGRHRSAHGTSTWLRLAHLSATFGLTRLEEECLLMCLAAETDEGYAKVFAFLHDDASRRAPSVGLALRLFAADRESANAARAAFHQSAPLLARRLVHLEDPSGPVPLIGRQIRLDDRIAAFLLGVPVIDEKLTGWVELRPPLDAPVRTAAPADVRRYLHAVVHAAMTGRSDETPVLYLYGPSGSGRRSLAEYAAAEWKMPLLIADARRVPSADGADVLWRLAREAVLQPAVILLEGFDDLLSPDRTDERLTFLRAVVEFGPVTFLSGSIAWPGDSVLSHRMFVSVPCPVPEAAVRTRLWTEHLSTIPHDAGEAEVEGLATRFDLTDGQIQRAVGLATSAASWRGAARVQPHDLSRACRTLAAPNLRDLAQLVEPVYRWTDIVLPDDQLAQLRELAAHVHQAQTVLDGWGFGRKLPYGRGVAALFEGPSGTGKTMAAQILAGELDLDLFKVDLSAVVSKYIGETEKNIGRVFAEAQNANAVLFFDEADALFAKRSELTRGDAHDRYANMETAYLLQRIEDHRGVVILATNFKQNLDEAFTRRLRFVVHFPFPDEEHRFRIWQQVFPPEAPLAADVDFRWLARRLKVAGGHIRSISLRAAYLAADRDTAIDMRGIREAARREVEKFGRIWMPSGRAAPGAAREAGREAVA